MRCLVVIDGEHYPPVIEAALADLERNGYEVVAAVAAGGAEKLPASGFAPVGGKPVRSGPDVPLELDRALDENECDVVIDLSDEPVLDYRRRHVLAAVALSKGIAYEGADFRFEPPPRPHISTRPTVAVGATGKRTGKTAVAASLARFARNAGTHPVVVAMGRGGPPDPELIRGDQLDMSPQDLVALADQGKHAASDYIEDALLARVPTIGCNRCGGGLAGAVSYSNVVAGVELANTIEGDVTILEGSGSALPPVHADTTLMVVPSSIPTEYVTGYMGPYRLLLADCVVVTMSENPFGTPSQISTLSSVIRDFLFTVRRARGLDELEVVRTVFRPAPTRTVEGADVFVATTAPEAAGDSITRHLQETQRCRVVGMTHSLSDRPRLESDLANIGDADVLLCEIKAAGIDVATRRALDAGVDVVYMRNELHGVDGDDVEAAFARVLSLSNNRFEG
ncbi:MAG: cyclic 2,3-diphosphoglycerate synthase, partial [Actinomycetota bacterium]|nr:cyclic 2,3-diphosphoglycerate synthase [Actinomycetota bacterium]